MLSRRLIDGVALSNRWCTPSSIVAFGHRERGYNQSELLAKDLAKRTGIPIATDVLTRTHDTLPQMMMMNSDERRENITGAFECVGDVAGKHILLVHDVVTTGAIIASCSTPLRAAGATSIWALSLAR